MKKILIAGIIVLGGVVAVGTYLGRGGEKTVTHTLSARAREYMQGRKDANDQSWRRVDVDQQSGSTYAAGTRVSVDECFSFIVPFPMKEARQEDHCAYRIFLDDPKGYVVAYRKDVSATSLDDLPDVKMRRLYTDKYTEGYADADGVRFTTFKAKADSYEKSSFYLSGGHLYIMNLIVQTNENLDAQFDRMLSSLAFIME